MTCSGDAGSAGDAATVSPAGGAERPLFTWVTLPVPPLLREAAGGPDVGTQGSGSAPGQQTRQGNSHMKFLSLRGHS